MARLVISILMIVLCGCAPVRYEIAGAAQGTTYSIIYYANDSVVSGREIDSLFGEFNSSCSLYDDNSLISKLNRNESDSVDVHITKCESLARWLNEVSDGAFDITTYPLSKAYGFLRDEPNATIDIDSLLEIVGHNKIKIIDGKLVKSDPRIAINLNSVAQGYSVDLVADFIRSKGVDNFLVELGGELYCSGTKPKGELWRVGVDKPIDGNVIAGESLATVITVTNRGINTSGNYRNFYTKGDKRINHIIDPRTGESSVNDMLSATVVAQSAALSDGIATMLMLLGSDKSKEFLLSRDDIEGYIIYSKADSLETFSTLKDYTNQPTN